RIEALPAQPVATVRQFQPAGPYYLGGFSFGGSVALEMARQLLARGERVAFLGIIDHTPPPVRYRRPTWWKPATLAAFAVNAGRWIGEDIVRAGRGRLGPTLGHKAGTALRQIIGLLRRRSGSGESDAAAVLA